VQRDDEQKRRVPVPTVLPLLLPPSTLQLSHQRAR
jgi:hypothetical protein